MDLAAYHRTRHRCLDRGRLSACSLLYIDGILPGSRDHVRSDEPKELISYATHTPRQRPDSGGLQVRDFHSHYRLYLIDDGAYRYVCLRIPGRGFPLIARFTFKGVPAAMHCSWFHRDSVRRWAEFHLQVERY